jgi:hypothetical protein
MGLYIGIGNLVDVDGNDTATQVCTPQFQSCWWPTDESVLPNDTYYFHIPLIEDGTIPVVANQCCQEFNLQMYSGYGVSRCPLDWSHQTCGDGADEVQGGNYQGQLSGSVRDAWGEIISENSIVNITEVVKCNIPELESMPWADASTEIAIPAGYVAVGNEFSDLIIAMMIVNVMVE